ARGGSRAATRRPHLDRRAAPAGRCERRPVAGWHPLADHRLRQHRPDLAGDRPGRADRCVALPGGGHLARLPLRRGSVLLRPAADQPRALDPLARRDLHGTRPHRLRSRRLIWFLVVGLVVLLALNVPVAFAMLATSIIYLLLLQEVPL